MYNNVPTETEMSKEHNETVYCSASAVLLILSLITDPSLAPQGLNRSHNPESLAGDYESASYAISLLEFDSLMVFVLDTGLKSCKNIQNLYFTHPA